MAIYPTPSTAITGGTVPAAFWNAQVRDPINFLINPVFCVTRATVAQSIGTGVWTALLFDVNEKDSDNGHSTVTNTSRYTSQTAGWYEVVGTSAIVVNGAGGRGARVAKNGTAVTGRGQMSAASGVELTTTQCTGMVFLAVNDYVEIQAWQSSGGPLNTAVFTDLAPYMHVRWASK